MQQITDYSTYHQSTANYESAESGDLAQIQQLIALAYEQNRPIRVRGKGHSMNGSSIPKQDELLLLSGSCNHFRFNQDGTITVGSGIAIWDVNNLLNKYGFQLYVYNDGGAPAASVGGYLSAGGIGEDSCLYGGFWETVEHVILINGKGERIKSFYGDGIFEWLFGSMGQLGFAYEICLRIKSRNELAKYPLGESGIITGQSYSWTNLAWYNLFTTPEHTEEAIRDLALLSRIHKHAWVSKPMYRYEIAFKKFNPPLLFPQQHPMVALGIWGDPWDDKHFNPKILKLLAGDFGELILEKPYFRRYVQTEFIFEGFDYEVYFGKEVFSGFKKIKKQLDPSGIFGKGIISVV